MKTTFSIVLLYFCYILYDECDGTHPTVDAHGLHIQVEELNDRRVEWAKVSKLAPSEESEEKA